MSKKKKKAAPTDPPPAPPAPPHAHPYHPYNLRPRAPTRGAPGVDFARLAWGVYEERLEHEIVIKLQGLKGGNIYHDRIRVEPGETAWHVKRYLSTYCGYDMAALRVVFDGRVLSDLTTFAALGTLEGDVFDVSLVSSGVGVQGGAGAGVDGDPIVVE
ncbi:uncharacterized protein LOC62_02G002936 [Vanrija pseudolonga]|uniref:Ubiquitin-like domain-containing protein n=1 Tax=Vanrija pseudolonga TaxID=143232 RepID=A0AAF0Y708_9TREE|nr:hypothetical protein LOC62_02G002936 [Vanrija pseudolonga]